MARSKRFKPLLRLAAHHEREAARELGRRQRAVSEAETRLAELTAYMDEYAQHLATVGRNGIGAGRLREFRGFLDKLQTAVTDQRERVHALYDEYLCYREQWLARRTQCQALDKAMERLLADERRAEDRREQKQTDEIASQGRFRRGGEIS